jgi:hypothetical protein
VSESSFFFSHMRYDTLAQMLTLGNIRAGNKMIVMETCSGLVLGAMMERMGGKMMFSDSVNYLDVRREVQELEVREPDRVALRIGE